MSDWADKSTDNLAARIGSGIALIAFGLGAAYAGGPWLAAAAAAAVTAMSFEWARMSERPRIGPAFVVCWLAGVTSVMAASWGRIDVALAVLAGGALVASLRRHGLGKRAVSAFGVLYVGGPCAGLVWLRGSDSGLAIVLGLFAVIWSADTMAYVGGRFLGGPKILPSLSPNKTWAGLACGAGAGAIAGWLYVASADAAAAGAALGGLFAAIGLAGDLFESLLKRRFGVKDASNLIPGHGGVMDRLDGLMAATLVAALAVAIWPSAPAALFGARG